MKNQSGGPFLIGSLAYGFAMLAFTFLKMGQGDPRAGAVIGGLAVFFILIPAVVIVFLPLWLLVGYPLMRWLPAQSLFWRPAVRTSFGVIVGLALVGLTSLRNASGESIVLPLFFAGAFPFGLTFYLLNKTEQDAPAISKPRP